MLLLVLLAILALIAFGVGSASHPALKNAASAPRSCKLVVVLVRLVAASLAGLLLGSAEVPGRHEARASSRDGIHKIRHVVIIMQENRSFDSYFGTYPG